VVRALDLRLDGREFDFRPPRLVLGWVTVFRWANHLSISLWSPYVIGQTIIFLFYMLINAWVTGKTV